MKIIDNAYVEFHYALVNAQNDALDNSRDGEPLPYIHGQGNIIPGLEQALAGREAGETFSVTVPPEAGYGLRDEARVSVVDSASFAAFESIDVGMLCQIEGENGKPQLVTITAIDEAEEEVTIDANHPFAGQTLQFEVEVMQVRAATADELSNGVR